MPRKWIAIYCNEGHEEEVLAALRELLNSLPTETGFDFDDFDACEDDDA